MLRIAICDDDINARDALHLQLESILMEETEKIVYEFLYFYSERRQVTVVTERGNFTFYGKLNEVEERTGGDFVRIHQRYLINGKKVSHIGSTSLLIGEGEDETELPISRGLREAASSKLARILLRG